MRHKITLLLILAFLHNSTAFAQVFAINNLSDKFIFEIDIDETSTKDIFKKGVIRVYLKEREQLLLEVKGDEFAFNTIEYRKQGLEIDGYAQDVVLFDDFNFDGKNDLAIQQSYSSKGPSYTIYLYNGTTFTLDEIYTQIIQTSQGKFNIDPENKEISIIGTGGCCYHVLSTYKIIDGYPFEHNTIIEEIDRPYRIETIRNWTGGKMEEFVNKTIDLNQEGIFNILSFKLLGNDKRVVLYNINDRMLYYALIVDNDKVEFSFPVEAEYKNPDFRVNGNHSKLTFQNQNVIYTVYDEEKQGRKTVGIKVTIDNEVYDLKGDVNTAKGSLKDIPVATLDNVYYD